MKYNFIIIFILIICIFFVIYNNIETFYITDKGVGESGLYKPMPTTTSSNNTEPTTSTNVSGSTPPHTSVGGPTNGNQGDNQYFF